MNRDNENLKQILSSAFTASLIRFAVIAFIVLVCFWAFLPFLPILMWALVLAIALYPARQFLEAKLGWSAARTSTLIAIVGVLLLGIPTAMVGNSFASKIFGAYEAYETGALVVPPPAESVKEWPLVGDQMHLAWGEAAADLPRFIEKRQPQLKSLSSWFVERASGAARSVFLMIGAVIIAGIMLAWAEPASRSIRKIFTSFSNDEIGPELHHLTTSTIRQVAIGIIGIAFLTAIVFGATVALAGVPAAALFTLIALMFAIMQLPVTIVALVAVGILWSSGETSTLHNSIFSVLIIAASLIDNFLKPMILGRGLAVPMPIVLIGALGGMMSGGILGMFIGAAFLSAGYQVFMTWVDAESNSAIADTSHSQSKDSEASP